MKSRSIKIALTSTLLATLTACGGGSGEVANTSGNGSSSTGNSSSGTDQSAVNNGGGTTNNSGSTNTTPGTKTKVATIDASYEVQSGFHHNFRKSQVLLDGNRLILAGGKKGVISGGTHDGHLAFSNQVHVLELDTGKQRNFKISAQTGHPHDGGAVADGIGETAYVQKIASNRYLITGGFQYQINAFDIDLAAGNVTTSSTASVMTTDKTGLNTTAFYTNGQGNALLPNGNVAFFGFNNGLYAMNKVMEYVVSSKSFRSTPAVMTLTRHNIDAYPMKDGRVLLAGGWDPEVSSETANSAPRRAEIFDPSNNTIVRIADYPEPKSDLQHAGVWPSTSAQICAGNYTYTIATDSWKQGCDLPFAQGLAPQLTNATPIEFQLMQSVYLGQMADGRYVYMDYKDVKQQTQFNDACACFPFEGTTKIRVVSIREE